MTSRTKCLNNKIIFLLVLSLCSSTRGIFYLKTYTYCSLKLYNHFECFVAGDRRGCLTEYNITQCVDSQKCGHAHLLDLNVDGGESQRAEIKMKMASDISWKTNLVRDFHILKLKGLCPIHGEAQGESGGCHRGSRCVHAQLCINHIFSIGLSVYCATSKNKPKYFVLMSLFSQGGTWGVSGECSI